MLTRFMLLGLLALSACNRGPRAGNGASGATATAASPSAPSTPAVLAVADAPEIVAKRYLQLGGQGDLDGARALVVDDCRTGPVGEVDAVKMMGARMNVTQTETSVESLQGDDARVRYTVHGAVHSDGGTTEFLGAQVHVAGVNIDDARLGGTLHLVRQGGAWRVTCH